MVHFSDFCKLDKVQKQFWSIYLIHWVFELLMLQNDIHNAGGANTVSSADPNDKNADEEILG